MGEDVLLRMTGISKAFPGVQALDDVHLEVEAGTVHALMGENGAGKSTLMKVLAGIYRADSGTIELDGAEVQIPDSSTALKLGIAMIHQELSAVPEMLVAENVYLGREPLNRFKLVDKKLMIADARAVFAKWQIDIDPRRVMKTLSVAQMQMVEIAKAISTDARLIIMDEPTSAITEREVDHLHRMIRSLRESGVAVIYITHKMDEVFRIADKVTVFRDGKHVATLPASELDRQKLITLMVGRELTHMFPKEHAEIGEVVLSVRGLTREGVISDISFELHRGEILGLAGLMGAGRTEVLEAIFGVTKVDAGEILIKGKKIRVKSPSVRDLGRHGPAHRGPKAERDHGRPLGPRQHDDRQPAALQPGRRPPQARDGACLPFPTEGTRDQDAVALAADHEPLWREPAEGARVALADDAARHPDDR